MTQNERGLTDRLQNIDPRYLYLIFFILVMGLIAFPINVPTPVTDVTIEMKEYIDNMEPGSVVLFAQTYPAGAKAEQLPQATVLAKYLLDNDMKLIGMSIREDGPVLDDWAWRGALGDQRFNELYGEQMAIIGFIPGREAAAKAFAENMRMVEKDFYGNDIDDLPVMDGIETAEDIDAICIISGSMSWINYYLRQMQNQYGMPVICGAQASMVPQMIPYYPDAIPAYILGLRGAREFEKVISPDQAIYTPNLQGMMDALSFGFIYITALIVITNLFYFAGQRVYEEVKK
jgi:hypothetical protein